MLKPGDNIYFKNTGVLKAWGEEGSNLIYLGDGYVVDAYGKVWNLIIKRKQVATWGNTDPEKIPIEAVWSPKPPSETLKTPPPKPRKIQVRFVPASSAPTGFYVFE